MVGPRFGRKNKKRRAPTHILARKAGVSVSFSVTARTVTPDAIVFIHTPKYAKRATNEQLADLAAGAQCV